MRGRALPTCESAAMPMSCAAGGRPKQRQSAAAQRPFGAAAESERSAEAERGRAAAVRWSGRAAAAPNAHMGITVNDCTLGYPIVSRSAPLFQ